MIVNNTIQSTVVSGLNEQWELLQKVMISVGQK
jgi:hypothetical protein